MRVLMETNQQGKLRITNEDTGEDITDDIGRVDIYIDTQKKVVATIELRNVQLKLKVKSDDDQDSRRNDGR